MTPEEIVEGIRKLVMDASVADTLSVVQNPLGKKPAAELIELSSWYNSLAQDDRRMVACLLSLCARQAVHGFLAVLDGARGISSAEATPDFFELRHNHGTETDVLSGPHGESLHELL